MRLDREKEKALTIPELMKALRYDKETGEFIRLVDRLPYAKAGDVAGSVKANGYLEIQVKGRKYMAHRLAWFYVFGMWPSYLLDHVDGDKLNNRVENLRECDDALNQQNIGLRGHNTSGHLGIYFNKGSGRRKRWSAYITVNKKRMNLGYFATKEEAADAYLQAKKELHKFQPEPRAKIGAGA